MVNYVLQNLYYNDFSVSKCCSLGLSHSLCILISAKRVERWMTLQNKDKNPSDLSDVEKSISTLLSVLRGWTRWRKNSFIAVHFLRQAEVCLIVLNWLLSSNSYVASLFSISMFMSTLVLLMFDPGKIIAQKLFFEAYENNCERFATLLQNPCQNDKRQQESFKFSSHQSNIKFQFSDLKGRN